MITWVQASSSEANPQNHFWLIHWWLFKDISLAFIIPGNNVFDFCAQDLAHSRHMLVMGSSLTSHLLLLLLISLSTLLATKMLNIEKK